MKNLYRFGAVLLSTSALLSACGGGGSSNSPPVAVQPPPPPPPAVLNRSVELPAGDENCFQGGTRTDTGSDTNANGTLDDEEVESSVFDCVTTQANDLLNFTRVSTFPVCLQQDPNCDTNIQRRAEILDVSTDGNLIIYTDPPRSTVGFVDISDAQSPQGGGTRDLPGVPTSLAIHENFAIVTVDRPETSGESNGSLEIINLTSRVIARSILIAGVPDSVAVSPDGTRALVAVENPNINGSDQPPIPGFLVALDISDADPANWATTDLALTGLADIVPDDPEPEFVDINSDNLAVISLQSNNHLVLLDLNTNMIIADFTAGALNVDQIDATNGEIDRVEQTERLVGVVREPDGVAWINSTHFATANEGDLNLASRGFTVFNTSGEVVFDVGNGLEHEAARLGHYPEQRSDEQGNEPESAEVGVFGDDRLLFIGSERGDLVYVYDVADPSAPLAIQSLPTPASPEGIKAIGSRNLLAVAGEEDNRSDGVRSAISLYEYDFVAQSYPSLISENRSDGTPIPWGALSGLAVDPSNDTILYSVEDSAFDSNRIFRIDISTQPARLTDEIRLTDANNVIATLAISGETSDRGSFDGNDRDDLLNADGTVDLDLEGISTASSGGFWVVAEGRGDADNTLFEPIDAVNLVVRVNDTGVIEEAIRLPPNVDAIQQDQGFAGIVEFDGTLYVPFQRPWVNETAHRIGRYDLTTEQWDFVFYNSDAPESQNGGTVNLAAISVTPSGEFRLIESDSEAGFDAAVKRIYGADLAGAAVNLTLSKTLIRDLLLEGDIPVDGGVVFDNMQAMTVLSDGRIFLVNDNDGTRNNVGETRLIEIE